MSSLTADTMNSWADKSDPVALHLKQTLLPVEGEGAVIFPPTYAVGDDRSPSISTRSQMEPRSARSTASAAKRTGWSRFSSTPSLYRR